MTTPTAFMVDTFYSGPVADRLAVARALHARHASALLVSPTLTDELERLRREADVLNHSMRALGLGRLCGQCASRPGGGCCSAAMADNADAILLLINLLLGVEVRAHADNGENCRFLGEQGCPFPVKPIFCLNYNCTHIINYLDAASLDRLQRQAALVLGRQTQVESLLLEALRRCKACG